MTHSAPHFHMGRRIFLVAALAGCVGGDVRAQVMSLDSVLSVIASANPELKVYDARIKAFDKYAEGARALDPPCVGAGFFMTPYNTIMWRPDGVGDPGMGSFMISAEQMIANARKRNANAAYMVGMTKVDAEMKNVMRNELFSMAKRSYYEWVVLVKKKDMLVRSEALLHYLVQAAEIRYTYGREKLNAYYKAKAVLGDVQNMQLMTDLEIEQMRMMLSTAMARDERIVFTVDTAFAPRAPEQRPADSTVVAERRSDLRAIDRNIDLLQTGCAARLPASGLRHQVRSHGRLRRAAAAVQFDGHGVHSYRAMVQQDVEVDHRRIDLRHGCAAGKQERLGERNARRAGPAARGDHEQTAAAGSLRSSHRARHAQQLRDGPAGI